MPAATRPDAARLRCEKAPIATIEALFGSPGRRRAAPFVGDDDGRQW
jgi:hypothetical protein